MNQEIRPDGGFRRSSIAAIAALAAWTGSLFLDTYVPYGASAEGLKGIHILALGWVALLGVSVAWLANGCLLVALARFRSGGAAFAAVAALLSLDALRISAYPDGQSNRVIYGYGAGILLWLASMGLGLVATGMRARERGDAQSAEAGWLREIGIVWLVVLSVGIGVFTIKDRAEAASAERGRLQNVVFKRGPVCDREPPVATARKVSSSVVEIAGLGAGYPFNEPGQLLRWGIPVVRAGGYDYSYIGAGIDRMMKIEKASDVPSTVLHFSTEPVRGTTVGATASAIRIRLVSADGANLINHLWTPDGSSFHYCPDYQQSPRADQQPRKVFMEALGVTDQRDPQVPNFWDSVTRVAGQVTQRESVAGAEWVNNNAGCPSDIGFSYDRASKEKIPVHSFFHGGAAFASVGPGSFSVCAEGVVYIYGSQRSSGDYFLTITRRTLKDFERGWSINVKVANADAALQERETRIVAVEEGGGTLKIRTRHYGHDHFLVIEAPLPSASGTAAGRAK